MVSHPIVYLDPIFCYIYSMMRDLTFTHILSVSNEQRRSTVITQTEINYYNKCTRNVSSTNANFRGDKNKCLEINYLAGVAPSSPLSLSPSSWPLFGRCFGDGRGRSAGLQLVEGDAVAASRRSNSSSTGRGRGCGGTTANGRDGDEENDEE